MKDKTNILEKVDAWLQRLAWFCGIVTGGFIVVFSWQQVEINKKLGHDEHLLQQPIFQVTFDHWQSDTSDMQDHVDFRVENKGQGPKSIETPLLYTFIKFEYSENYKERLKTYYIPIEYYFGWVLSTRNLTGKVAFTYTYIPNQSYFTDLYNESIKYLQEYHVSAFVSTIHITKIDYTDKYNDMHTVYFINEENVEENEAMTIMQQSEKQFGYNKWRIEDLNISKLKEICGL